MSLSRMRMSPRNAMSSSMTGIVGPNPAAPSLMESTIFGFALYACWRGVTSVRSFGVKEMPQSIMTMSSCVFGNVRTWSIRGALFPSVNVESRSESRNAGVFALSTWSTVLMIVAESTGS
jgi:hypothetical protein